MDTGKKVTEKEKFWIFGFRDHLAGIQTSPNCVISSDVYGDGDYKFLIADTKRTLKAFGGTSLQTETRLLSVPSSIAAFYAEGSDDVQRSVVAVACGPHVFMYRNMKPYYRFIVPPVDLDAEESSVWDALCAGTVPVAEAIDKLEDCRRKGVELCTRSTDLLSYDNLQEQEKFVARFTDPPPKFLTIVVCMASLYLDRVDEKARGCLVFGTENQYVYVWKSNASGVKLRIKLPSTPICIVAAGAFNVDYRIIVACRDARIYSIKNNKLSSSVICADAHIVQIVRYDKLVAVATTRNTLSFYNLKGKRQSCVFLPSSFACFTVITEAISGKARGIAVALNNATLRIYVGKILIHESPTYDNVTAMYFGQYGREDAALILVLQNGSLVVQMLHRQASFECTKMREVALPPELDTPIPVPPLTSVFVAQAERERLYGASMHESFQKDLCGLRANIAKSYLHLIKGRAAGQNTESAATHSLNAQNVESKSVRMLTTVQGIGPIYKIRVALQNVTENTLWQLSLVVNCRAGDFRVPVPIVDLPFLVPSVIYNNDFVIERLSDDAVDESVRVYVCRSSGAQPLAAAVIDLPEADLPDDRV